MEQLWLYLYFPQLQLDTLFTASKDNCDEYAVIIVDPSNHNICQVNEVATTSGIQKGMSLGAATLLSHQLQVLPYQSETEVNKLYEIADLLYLVTSDIAIDKPNGLFLRIHNMLNLYDNLEAYWQSIKNQLSPLALSYSYATGHSPLAARLLAKRGVNNILSEHHVLKNAVANSPLTCLEFDDKTQQKLTRVGIKTARDLMQIPLQDLAKRFDIILVNYLGRLTGEFKHPMTFYHPPESFDRYLELLYDIEDTQRITAPIKHLLKKLETFLKVRDRLTQQLDMTFYQRDIDIPIKFTVGSEQGEYLTDYWLELTALKLENIQLEAAVFAIQLTVHQTFVRSPEKNDLFEGKKGATSLLQLVSRLQAKLGEEAIRTPVMKDDFRPEIIASYDSPLASEQTLESNIQPYAIRPSFLLEAPQPLLEKVSLILGPERVDSGWWENQSLTRDYFVARTSKGQWYWVFRTPESQWYLHGVFS
ncbi:DNA polymerase Y family protein [Alteromonadaceae bacterium M269]|nr:DNA polymerase Y family protein [Alteromonadaceae bacterium M269]